MPQLTMSSPTGSLRITERDGEIVEIRWTERAEEGGDDTPLLREARRQLEEYFAGRRQAFDLPVRASGTPFQQAIWREMQAIPYGQTRTYGELARAVRSHPRAVGGACGKNPVPIVIPCHRVMGGAGRLTGFSGGEGVDTKRALLALEGLMLV